MASRDLIGIACSAAGLAPLRALVAGLPRSIPASALVVRHLSADSRGLLPSILARSGELPAAFARHGEPVSRGRLRIAPPGHYLLVHGEKLVLARGPKIHGVRPSADVLFRSMARWYGPRAVAVVLSGRLADGAAGAAMVAARGGAVVVQQPSDADYASLPDSALRAVPGAVMVPASRLAEAVLDLVSAVGPQTFGSVEERDPL